MTDYIVHRIEKNVYHIEEKAETPVFMTLVTGTQRALLFDTGYGTGDILGTLAGLTGLPCEVVLSHHHSDHTYGAWQFESAWIHEKDRKRCLEENSPAARACAWRQSAYLKSHTDRDSYASRGCC